MRALRVALAFKRPDVDRLLSELTHEEFEEWAMFLELEPNGWQGAAALFVAWLAAFRFQSQRYARFHAL